MTAEQVYQFSTAYRLYFSTDSYDFIKYRGVVKRGVFMQQRDRQFYYRLATKFSDSQIHAALMLAYFFKPKAYIADVVAAENMNAGLDFSTRAENGMPLYLANLYELRKRLTPDALDAWLYAPRLSDGSRAVLPDCLADIMNRSLPLDLACALLLIPHDEYGYHWPQYWETREPAGFTFGVRSWLTRLRKFDQLLAWHHTTWRRDSRILASRFWSSYTQLSLMPIEGEQTLFS